MSTARPNPYLGRTRGTIRPEADQGSFQRLSPGALAAAQAFWDAAEHERKREDRIKSEGIAIEQAQSASYETERVSRDDIYEEHSSKALENRLRVAFLSRRGATVAEWNDARAEIIAQHFSDQDANPVDSEPRGFSRGY